MGEYERLNNMIKHDQATIDLIDSQLEHVTDCNKRELLLSQKYDLQIGIGEIKGALLEMAEIDGFDDAYEAIF